VTAGQRLQARAAVGAAQAVVDALTVTAPIAGGNSGGPILDQAGHIVGLVYSSLNKDIVRNAENVNFGVKGVVVRSFLNTAGVEPRLLPQAQPRPRSDIVREARTYIYRIRGEA